MKVRSWTLVCTLWGVAETVLMLRAWMKPWQGTVSLAVFGASLLLLVFWGLAQGEAVQRRFQELEPEAWQRLLDSGTAGARALLRLRRAPGERLSGEARELLDAYAACGRIGSGLFIWTMAMIVLFTSSGKSEKAGRLRAACFRFFNQSRENGESEPLSHRHRRCFPAHALPVELINGHMVHVLILQLLEPGEDLRFGVGLLQLRRGP